PATQSDFTFQFQGGLDLVNTNLTPITPVGSGADHISSSSFLYVTSQVTAAEKAKFHTEAQREKIATEFAKNLKALFIDVSNAVELTDSPDPGTISYRFQTTPIDGFFGDSSPAPPLSGNGVDARVFQTTVVNARLLRNASENAFLLSQATNRLYQTDVLLYV